MRNQEVFWSFFSKKDCLPYLPGTASKSLERALECFAIMVLTQAVYRAQAAELTIQSQSSFDAAIANHSTAPSYVLITVTDETTNITRNGCVLATFLLGALHIENNPAADNEDWANVRREASLAPAHSFRFRSKQALSNLNFDHFETANPEACALLRSGRAAYESDRPASLHEGQPP